MSGDEFFCQCDRERQRAAAGLTTTPTRVGADGVARWNWEEDRGCHTEADHVVERFEGRELRRCPRRLVPDWCWEVLALYRQFEVGQCPEPGGLLDQAAGFWDAMMVVQGAVNGVRARAQARAEEEQARGGQ